MRPLGVSDATAGDAVFTGCEGGSPLMGEGWGVGGGRVVAELGKGAVCS